MIISVMDVLNKMGYDRMPHYNCMMHDYIGLGFDQARSYLKISERKGLPVCSAKNIR